MIYPVPGIMTPGREQAARIAREWCACGITHEPVPSDIWRNSRRPVKLPDESAIVRAKTTRGPVQAKVVSEPCPCIPQGWLCGDPSSPGANGVNRGVSLGTTRHRVAGQKPNKVVRPPRCYLAPSPDSNDCSPWRPGSPVMAQCKLGRPGCGRWRGSRARQHPGVRRACVRRTRAKPM